MSVKSNLQIKCRIVVFHVKSQPRMRTMELRRRSLASGQARGTASRAGLHGRTDSAPFHPSVLSLINETFHLTDRVSVSTECWESGSVLKSETKATHNCFYTSCSKGGPSERSRSRRPRPNFGDSAYCSPNRLVWHLPRR